MIERSIHVSLPVATLSLITYCLLSTVQHSCNEVSGSSNTVQVSIKILPKTDPVYRVYAFDASQDDTTLTANRIDSCMYDTSGISDPDVDTIDITLDVDISGSTFPCGAAVVSFTMYCAEVCRNGPGFYLKK